MRNALLFLPIACGAAAAQGLTPPLTLAVDEPFPVIGSPVQFTLSGPPSSLFSIQGSVHPTELPLGTLGTLFLDPAKLTPIASGALDGTGAGSAVVPIPANPALDGLLFHLQAGALSGFDIGLSNSTPIRIGVAPTAGPRNPESIAITPDGTKAYVAHQEDGGVSVIDVASETVLRDFPVGPPPDGKGFPVRVAVDPEGRHAFVVNPWTRVLSVIHVASDSVVALLDVPKACRDVAFDFSGPAKIVYVTNERDDAVLRFAEGPPGAFAPLAPVPVQGRDPGPIAVHADGRLVVGNRSTHEIEVLDPTLLPGDPTVARLPLNKLPYDVEVVGDRALVPTFEVAAPGDGRNDLLEIDLTGMTVLGAHLHDHGTDYVDVTVGGGRVALTAAGSGSVVIGDAALAFLGISDLAPFQPVVTPQESAFAGDRLFVASYFRDSVAVVDLSVPAPFPTVNEIALAHDGVVKVPLVDLTQEDDGDWWFRTVQFFNGTPQNPNPVTCATCHPFGAGSDGLTHPSRQAIPMFEAGLTGPWGATGGSSSLLKFINSTFFAHGTIGGTIPFQADLDVLAYLTNDAPPPPSPFLEPDGALSTSAQAGKVVFEGVAGCSTCHTAPLFIPVEPSPKTIAGGVGTGLAPANVPSLRGAWSTGPYLHDHSAATLMDVLLQNPGDQHGTTSGLTGQQMADLVEYVRSL